MIPPVYVGDTSSLVFSTADAAFTDVWKPRFPANTSYANEVFRFTPNTLTMAALRHRGMAVRSPRPAGDKPNAYDIWLSATLVLTRGTAIVEFMTARTGDLSTVTDPTFQAAAGYVVAAPQHLPVPMAVSDKFINLSWHGRVIVLPDHAQDPVFGVRVVSLASSTCYLFGAMSIHREGPPRDLNDGRVM